MLDLSATSRARVIVGSAAGIVLCVAAALFVDSFNFPTLSPEALRRSILVDVLLPAFLAGPLLFLLLSKMRQLAIAHRDMTVIASTDSLTRVLNRGAFTMMVDAYLTEAKKEASLRSGSLLVVDADHFKLINDTLGHQQGDAALQMIAETIRTSVRSTDLVGRIGGEEFGIFLPGADPQQAAAVAEKIRASIAQIEFPASGPSKSLSVSVGGAVFADETSFDALFLIADKCLYAAKSSGRNRVDIRQVA
jgi:diguanylate cyclase